MKSFIKAAALGAVATVLLFGANNSLAQERGRGNFNFDPEQMRQRMMEMYRERLEVTKDEEWKVIEPRIAKVTELRREAMTGGFGGFGRGRGGGPGGGGERGGGGRGGGGASNPEVEALEKALESKASADEIKAKLAKLRESRKAKEAELAKAQDDLRKLLSARQEAQAVLAGLLN